MRTALPSTASSGVDQCPRDAAVELAHELGDPRLVEREPQLELAGAAEPDEPAQPVDGAGFRRALDGVRDERPRADRATVDRQLPPRPDDADRTGDETLRMRGDGNARLGLGEPADLESRDGRAGRDVGTRVRGDGDTGEDGCHERAEPRREAAPARAIDGAGGGRHVLVSTTRAGFPMPTIGA
jgi:hypothetical protein